VQRRWWVAAVAVAPAIALAATGLSPLAHASAGGAKVPGIARSAGTRTGAALGVPFCKIQGKRYAGSSGAQMYCHGPRAVVKPGPDARRAGVPQGPGAGPNVDAARVSEDVSEAGVPAQGQSETSIAAAGQYVVEAWNDATLFFSNCPSTMSKEEGTGLGFSANGGKSFTDLGGLPNRNCRKYLYSGDPSVAAYRVGGRTYFYISSLYLPVTGNGPTKVAFDACQVVGSGKSATLSCGQPVVSASSTQCQVSVVHKKLRVGFCSFLDKDFIAVDPARGRLYTTISDFQITGSEGPTVTMSVCDLGNSSGGTGPAGGAPAAPVCEHGTALHKVAKHLEVGKPYFTVARQDRRGCDNEGSMPAVDPVTGTAYVGYEFNSDTAIGAIFACQGSATPIQNVLTREPLRCLRLAATSPCAGPAARISVPVITMAADTIPGYNRFPGNDFPRLAVSHRFGTVSMVWNDARFHPMGDILLQSFRATSLRPVQAKPVRLDRPHDAGLSFLPAVRSATRSGVLDVTWFSRSSVTTSLTNVLGALGVSPVTRSTPPNVRITDVASDWDHNSSLIVPNFGDYTDNAVVVTGQPPYVGSTLFVAWSDGRLGVPQPFSARVPVR
jgi:hypothetical protein